MPIYEYVCMECEGRFDRLLGHADAEPDCPRCGGTRVRRQISVFAAATSPASEISPAPRASGGCACGGACACRG